LPMPDTGAQLTHGQQSLTLATEIIEDG
jgi:hypothetical protein